MTLISVNAVALYGCRERSHSEAQVIHFNVNACRNHSSAAMGTGTAAKPEAPNHNKNCMKRHNHRHHHRHHGDWPRAKSLDLHGVHKKNQSRQYKHGSTAPPVLKLQGNLWIRPAATTTVGEHVPHLCSTIAGMPTLPSPIDGQGLANLATFGGAAPARHVSNDSTYSPAWLDNEMSFGSCRRSILGPAITIFGESGKPIRPQLVVGYCTP